MYLLLTKIDSYDIREFPIEARIPTMYFAAQGDDFQNTRYYLPADLYSINNINAKKKVGTIAALNVSFYLKK